MEAAFLVSAIYQGRSPLGCPAKHARPRPAHRLPVAVAPALFGAAAAVALAVAPAASASAAVVPANHVAANATTATGQSGATAARLLSVTRPAVQKTAAAPAKYTVKSGDTLSAIAKHVYRSTAYWPALFDANKGEIPNPNLIQVGQVLTVPAKPAKIPAAPVTTTAPAPVYRQASTPVYQSAPVQSAAVSTTGDSSLQQCIIARESGGDSQVMNSSGHYGLYQFSASTWAAYGGNPADFGNASVAEQNQVYNNAIAAGGASNWTQYDGC
jgi:LysM repeat protein